jgi:PPIC-type PPIASE domain
MFRLFFICMLASVCATAQSAPPQPSSNTSAPLPATQAAHPENVRPDTIVVEVQGLCTPLGTGTIKQTPCITQFTRDQFSAMVDAINVPMTTTAAQRTFAESYIQLLTLADAAEKAGIEKDPRFIELMKIVRVRSLADAYRHFLEDKANNPTPDELEAFYKQNAAKYEQIKVEKVIIPPVNRSHPPMSQAEVAKKTKEIADKIRERAVKGEDMGILQNDVYKELGLPSAPNVDLGARRRGTFTPNLETELFTLKPGEVTKVETESAGLTIYRLRSHDFPTLDSIRTEVLRDMRQQYVGNAIKSAEANVHSNLNLDYFVPFAAYKGPVPTRPSRATAPGQIPPAPAASPSAVATPKK